MTARRSFGQLDVSEQFIDCFSDLCAAVYAANLLRYIAGTDRLVYLCEILNRETLAEVDHHGRVEKRLIRKLLEPEKILDIRVFSDGGYVSSSVKSSCSLTKMAP